MKTAKVSLSLHCIINLLGLLCMSLANIYTYTESYFVLNMNLYGICYPNSLAVIPVSS